MKRSYRLFRSEKEVRADREENVRIIEARIRYARRDGDPSYRDKLVAEQVSIIEVAQETLQKIHAAFESSPQRVAELERQLAAAKTQVAPKSGSLEEKVEMFKKLTRQLEKLRAQGVTGD